LVKKARERGYLSKPRQPRRAEGHLTPEAILILQQVGVRHRLLGSSAVSTRGRTSDHGEH
jgi:hypothetical protein